MRVIPTSPRLRRRLAWGGALAAVLALAAALVVVTAPTRQPELPATAQRPPGWEPPPQPRTRERSVDDLAEPLGVAAEFLRTAVARKRVGDSWELVAPELRAGYTRATWARGDIPVVPYPVDSARWELDYSYEDEIGLLVALFPPRGSKTGAAVFTLDLRALGAEPNRRWVVSAFTPANQRTVIGPGSEASGNGLIGAARPARESGSTLSAAWLLVPVGVLVLALLVPAVLGVLYLLRVKRAEREWARGGAGLLDPRELEELVRVVEGDARGDQRQAERDEDGA